MQTQLLKRANKTFQVLDVKMKNVVIGGGVVGLAIASKLSKTCPDTLLLEKNSFTGQETSSRNSEVIHRGLYYPNDSLKTKLCIEGQFKLYNLCEKMNIPYKRVTKWTFSQSDEESDYLNKLHKKSKELDLNLYFITKDVIQKEEPNLKASQVLVSPDTGIVDSHKLMEYFEYDIKQNGGEISLNTSVIGIEKESDGYLIFTNDFAIKSERIINAAGLYSDQIASYLMKIDEKIHLFKGNYYAYRGPSLVKRLVYPIPEKNIQSLGIHATVDISEKLKFGPDLCYLGTDKSLINYTVQEDLEKFYNYVVRYLPKLDKSKLYPDYCGIRPKLSGPNEPFQDFVIREESKRGFPNFVNLLGIESPGLTASLAIADHVEKLLI